MGNTRKKGNRPAIQSREDRISKLPDDVIHRILSFLPTLNSPPKPLSFPRDGRICGLPSPNSASIPKTIRAKNPTRSSCSPPCNDVSKTERSAIYACLLITSPVKEMEKVKRYN
ncbi:hypothetical protein Tsubulata_038856 [Turnera subulata]|uniref:F-box domain-containing protein n=1 Tax=Turnera subulata TaxID=218843 RepID=A0A9Q0JB58_9ROSI|nr:hypothetical protein Tsubulata_038856 [Turnera subulata]